MTENPTVLTETDADREDRKQNWRLQRALHEAPALLAHVRGLALQGSPERGEVLREMSAPLRLTPLTESDAVYGHLAEWTLNLAEEMKIAPPATVLRAWRTGEEIAGFRPGTTPNGAHLLTSILTLWLLAHATEIEAWPAKGWRSYREYRDDVTDMLWMLRCRFPMEEGRPRHVLARPCPLCGEGAAVTADWFSENMRDVDVSCSACGFRIDPPLGMLDRLDWEVQETRACTCRYPGDPAGGCPIHHPREEPA